MKILRKAFVWLESNVVEVVLHKDRREAGTTATTKVTQSKTLLQEISITRSLRSSLVRGTGGTGSIRKHTFACKTAPYFYTELARQPDIRLILQSSDFAGVMGARVGVPCTRAQAVNM